MILLFRFCPALRTWYIEDFEDFVSLSPRAFVEVFEDFGFASPRAFLAKSIVSFLPRAFVEDFEDFRFVFTPRLCRGIYFSLLFNFKGTGRADHKFFTLWSE
jgi:hypothetical protein